MTHRFFIAIMKMPFQPEPKPVMISRTRKALFDALIEHGEIYFFEPNKITVTNCSYTQFLERYNLQMEQNKGVCIFQFRLKNYDDYIPLHIYERETNQLTIL